MAQDDAVHRTEAGNGPHTLKDLALPALSLVLGAIVLLPASVGQVTRPYTWSALLPAFIGLACASVLMLLCTFLTDNWQHKRWRTVANITHGLGNFGALGALGVLAVFLVANYCEDLYASPKITNVKMSPSTPRAGDTVEVEVEITNQSGRRVQYEWELDGKSAFGMRTAYLKLPDQPGRYLATVMSFYPGDGAGDDTRSANDHRADRGQLVRFWIEARAKDASPPPVGDVQAGQPIVQICNGATNVSRARSKPPGATASQANPSASRQTCR
jgi:hypothetical protein